MWQSCDGDADPTACSRYVLVQRGDHICGIWSYVATGDLYEGRLRALALSPTTARRTHACGRPGSEAQTECDAGWDSVDKPLRLCGSKLADLAGKDGACTADFEHVASGDAQVRSLAEQPWVQSCLAGAAPEAAK